MKFESTFVLFHPDRLNTNVPHCFFDSRFQDQTSNLTLTYHKHFEIVAKIHCQVAAISVHDPHGIKISRTTSILVRAKQVISE
jgi:hypothetical protein